MKNLQPSMRKKTRYIKFKIHSEENIEFSDLVNSFWKISINYLGSKELSSAEPWLIANKYGEEEQIGVIRVNRDYEDDMRAVLTLVNLIGGIKSFIEVENVSGSIS